VNKAKPSILHLCSREMVRELRDEILRLKGYHVISTASIDDVPGIFRLQTYSLVLIDVEGESRVSQAEKLCSDIREMSPDQAIAFVCNHRVSIHSDCPDEVIRSEFNPEALVKGVQQLTQ
jgi:DNA-binding response OmpR family regulator